MPNCGGKFIRSSGTGRFGLLIKRFNFFFSIIKLPSRELYIFSNKSYVTIGVVIISNYIKI